LPRDQAQPWCSRQVIDVPVAIFDVTEHRALGVHLRQGQMLPFARAAKPLGDVVGLAVVPAQAGTQ